MYPNVRVNATQPARVLRLTCVVCSVAVVSDASFDFEIVSDAGGHVPLVAVRGGGLAQPIAVNVRMAGASLRIVGITIDNGEEVTSNTLRSIRVAHLAAELQKFLREELADWHHEESRVLEWFESQAHMDPDDVEFSPGAFTGPREYLSAEEHMALELAEIRIGRRRLTAWLEESGEDVVFKPRTRGMSAPTDAEYRRFALIYLEELEAGERGAKARTARRSGMGRQTAYRWIQECQTRGLVPQEAK